MQSCENRAIFRTVMWYVDSMVALGHTGFRTDDFDHLYSGWNSYDWEPLKKFLT
jgi:hypothetical protein